MIHKHKIEEMKILTRQSSGEMRKRMELRSKPRLCFPARTRFDHIIRAWSLGPRFEKLSAQRLDQ